MTEETIVKYVIKGYEYVTEEIGYTVTHNDNGDIKTWKNPLISTTELAKDLEEWLASYYLGMLIIRLNGVETQGQMLTTYIIWN